MLTACRKILWGSGIARDPPTVAYDDVMSSDLAALKWLEKIVRRNHRPAILDSLWNSGPIWFLFRLRSTGDNRGHGDSDQEN
jgi:hypothetical protein